MVRKYRSIKSTYEDKEEIEQEQNRELVYYQDEYGSWVIHARLPAEAGSLLVKAIEAVATSEQQEQGENVSADRSPAVTSRKTYGQARADAIVSMAEHFLATCDQNGQWQGLKGSERCQVMLHVGIGTLQNRCDLDGKHWLSPKAAQRLSCDASLVTVLENDQGQVLTIGRRARTVPPSIKRASDLRDTTCRLHQGLFNIHVEKASAYEEAHRVFSTPSGKHIKASFFPQFSQQSATTTEQVLRDAAPSVNSTTAITEWAGENCEYPVAMDVLVQLDGILQI